MLGPPPTSEAGILSAKVISCSNINGYLRNYQDCLNLVNLKILHCSLQTSLAIPEEICEITPIKDCKKETKMIPNISVVPKCQQVSVNSQFDTDFFFSKLIFFEFRYN
jgi:hypothetical protein